MHRHPRRRRGNGPLVVAAGIGVLLLNLIFYGALLVGALFILRAFDVL